MASTRSMHPAAVALFVLVGVVAVMSEECLPGELTDTCTSIGKPEVIKISEGRKLLQKPRGHKANSFPSSVAPNLANRRSLLQERCSDTDNSPEGVKKCTNAVRMYPNDFSFNCGFATNGDQLGELYSENSLDQAAQYHSEDNARMGSLSHTGSDGSRVSDRIKSAGYDFNSVRENIAFGYNSARDVVYGWMCSEGHRKNIMSCDIADIGVGIAVGKGGRHYHTQVFACPRGVRCSCGGGGGSRESSSLPPIEKEPSQPSSPDFSPSPSFESPEEGSGFFKFPTSGQYYPSSEFKKRPFSGSFGSGGQSGSGSPSGYTTIPSQFSRFYTSGHGAFNPLAPFFGDASPEENGNKPEISNSPDAGYTVRRWKNGVSVSAYANSNGRRL